MPSDRFGSSRSNASCVCAAVGCESVSRSQARMRARWRVWCRRLAGSRGADFTASTILPRSGSRKNFQESFLIKIRTMLIAPSGQAATHSPQPWQALARVANAIAWRATGRGTLRSRVPRSARRRAIRRGWAGTCQEPSLELVDARSTQRSCSTALMEGPRSPCGSVERRWDAGPNRGPWSKAGGSR